jgi:hypothetical protein
VKPPSLTVDHAFSRKILMRFRFGFKRAVVAGRRRFDFTTLFRYQHTMNTNSISSAPYQDRNCRIDEESE